MDNKLEKETSKENLVLEDALKKELLKEDIRLVQEIIQTSSKGKACVNIVYRLSML